VAVALLGFGAWAQEIDSSGISLPTEPALTPSGDRIVFTYQGDLWSAAVDDPSAVRLTVHDAYDHGAMFSPDGETLYFMSNRFGNDDIWAMPAEGGDIRRITYSTNTDQLTGTNPAGSELYFLATRVVEPDPGRYLWAIPPGGGAARPLMGVHARAAAVSPDGTRIVYARRYASLSRKHYRSSATADLWLYDGPAGEHYRLTEHDGQDSFPLWDPKGNGVYFVSDVDGTFNLWRLDLNTDERTQVTHFEGDGVRNPCIAASGDLLAFERGTALYVLEPGSEPRRLEIHAPGDVRADPEEILTVTGDAGDFALSPDEKQVAMVVREDVGVMKIDGGEMNNLTDDAASQYSVAWPKDSDWVYYISNDRGRMDIYRAKAAEGEPNLSRALELQVEQVTDTPEPELELIASPDGSKLAYVRTRGDLIIRDLGSGEEHTLLEGWAHPSVEWSPDGRWIAYSRADDEYNSDVWIIPADGSADPVNVSMDPADDGAPHWSPDGSMLAFHSYRGDDDWDIYMVYLTEEAELAADREAADDVDELPDQVDLQDEPAGEGPEDEGASDEAEGEGEEEEELVVEIDFEDIHMRLRRIASSSASEMYPRFSPDSESIAYSYSWDRDRGLWTMSPRGEDKSEITSGYASHYTWDEKGQGLYYLSGGRLSYVRKGGGSSAKGHRMTIHRDARAERLQVFEEAWEVMGRQYYDPNMHGVDWEAMREKYRAAAVEASDRREFGTIMNLLLGELNSSHMGFYASGPSVQSYDSGWLGLRYDETHPGPGLKVDWVLPDGPCDQDDVDIVAGDVLLSIDGHELDDEVSRWLPLQNRVGDRVLVLRQRGEGDDAKVDEIIVRPVSWGAISGLCYDALVEQRRELVEEYSGGRLAYIHVPGMSMTSVEAFERDLYAEGYGKDGLIIDVRDNGGGSTADHLLAMLAIEPHAQTRARGGGPGYPQSRRPSYIWSKPIVLLINQSSFSNAEIFAHAVKTLDLGKLVGVPTAGGVISTGSVRFVDGSSMRMPGRGWFIGDTGVDMEGNGAQPDIHVEITPEDEAAGRDPQLRTAIDVLLEELPGRS
jgi:tricorn protease